MKKIDWFKYLQRANTVHYVTIYNKAYFVLSEKVTGFRFKHMLCHHDGKLVTFYLSKSEQQVLRNHFVQLIKNNKELVKQWYKAALRLWKKEEEIISTYKTCSEKYIYENYKQLYQELFEIFLYCSVIPFYVLDALTLENKSVDDEVKTWFEHLRTRTRVNLHELVLEKIWKAVAKKINCKNHFDISFLTVDEVQDALENNTTYKEEIEQRKQGCVFHYDDKKMKEVFFYGNDALQNFGIAKDQIINKDKLQGKTACKGYAKGRVSIINRVKDMQKFQDGDVVVSINTNPSLLPVLKRCSAIVTDDGGLVCHAAVLSRELNIPCVIGTKHATQVFKDGDLIEVDADNGIVKKLD